MHARWICYALIHWQAVAMSCQSHETRTQSYRCSIGLHADCRVVITMFICTSRPTQLFVLMLSARCQQAVLTGGALWWMMSHLNDSLHVRTAVKCCDLKYCSECVEKGWSPLTNCNDDPGVSRGPHVQCTQSSDLLTPQLEGYWQAICDLPGIRLRVMLAVGLWQRSQKPVIYCYIY